MRVTITSILLVLLAALSAACAPEDKCSGELYYDAETTNCLRCPMDAKFKGGTCECKENFEFKNKRCVLKEGAEAPKGCENYCDFAKVCVGDNGLVASALETVILALHATEPAMCVDACKTDLGNDGSNDPVVKCIEDGRAAAMCAESTVAGITGAFTLIGQCCGANMGNELCKSICVALKSNPMTAMNASYCP